MTRVALSAELPATTASRRGPSQASAWGASATIPMSTVATWRSRTGSTTCSASSSRSPSTSSDRSGDHPYPEIPYGSRIRGPGSGRNVRGSSRATTAGLYPITPITGDLPPRGRASPRPTGARPPGGGG
jgi:hypothetical protein